ncbi:hypothetical protein A0H81_02317 [Grifola frondosa]|uniref:Uncharacterized protein n=1 Tax=Grifola frondosa TaxID=5627 RepID=A0A1C7MLN9_GRIFR|nr:hypothetical protein A0H81_02317 [Grifola frondosa]
MFPGLRASPRQPSIDFHHDPPNDGPWRQACQPEGLQGVSGPSLKAQLGLESSLPGLYPSLPVDPNPGHDPPDDPDPDPFLPGTWVPNSPEPVKRQVQNRNPCAIYLELREQLEAVGPLTREDHALLKNFLDLSDEALQRRILEKKLEEFGREKVDRPFPKFGKRFPYNELRIAAAKRAEDERKRQAEIQELNRRHKERIEAERLERRRAEMQRQREEAERVQREREEAERLRLEREAEERLRREREEEEHRRREAGGTPHTRGNSQTPAGET